MNNEKDLFLENGGYYWASIRGGAPEIVRYDKVRNGVFRVGKSLIYPNRLYKILSNIILRENEN